MQSSVHVTASGPVLSLLLYETTKKSGYQMGFLLGAVVNQVIDTISDSQIRDEKTETIINVSSILPLPTSSGVINGAGKIDTEKLSLIVKSEKSQQHRNGAQTHDIVGWYSFKRDTASALHMSMRERILHLQLAEKAKDFSQESTPELFVMCLLTNTLTSQATHVFKHCFMRYLTEKPAFDVIPFQINNLGMSQPAQYLSTACAPSRAVLLNGIFDRVKARQQGEGGDHTMLLVQAELQVMLNHRVSQLSASERSRVKLEGEVDQLKKRLASLERDIRTKGKTYPRGHDNGSETYEPRQHGEQNSNSRTINRNADRGGNQDHNNSVCKSAEDHINYDRTSPVLGSSRRKAGRP